MKTLKIKGTDELDYHIAMEVGKLTAVTGKLGSKVQIMAGLIQDGYTPVTDANQAVDLWKMVSIEVEFNRVHEIWVVDSYVDTERYVTQHKEFGIAIGIAALKAKGFNVEYTEDES